MSVTSTIATYGIDSARQVIGVLSGGHKPGLSFVTPQGNVPCEISYKPIDYRQKGFLSGSELLLTASRATNESRRLTDPMAGLPLLVAEDADILVRALVPAVLNSSSASAVVHENPSYENLGEGNWHYFGFQFNRESVLPNALSYDGSASASVSVFRNGVSLEGFLQLTHTVGVRILINPEKNDQPIIKKGEPYWDGKAMRVRENDIFSEDKYYYGLEVGNEALAQALSQLFQSGAVTFTNPQTPELLARFKALTQRYETLGEGLAQAQRNKDVNAEVNLLAQRKQVREELEEIKIQIEKP